MVNWELKIVNWILVIEDWVLDIEYWVLKNWELLIDYWVLKHWLLLIDYWLLKHWVLLIDYWLLSIETLAIVNWLLFIGYWELSIGNWEILPSLIKSATYHLRKSKVNSALQQCVMRCMKQILKSNSKKDRQAIFAGLKSELLVLKENPEENHLFHDVDLIAWVERKAVVGWSGITLGHWIALFQIQLQFSA